MTDPEHFVSVEPKWWVGNFGGMVAFGVHKMSASQAKQVEEHTGVPPEELEDEDLEAAMAELNIPKQELTEEDKAAGAGTDE